MKAIETLDDAKQALDAYKTWASSIALWIIDLAAKKKLNKSQKQTFYCLFDWDMLEDSEACQKLLEELSK